jgi:signal peptidase I
MKNKIRVGLCKKDKEQFGPIVVPSGQVFVLSDNRGVGMDSRDWGAVPLGFLEGRVFMIWLSFDWFSVTPTGFNIPDIRWDRVIRSLD